MFWIGRFFRLSDCRRAATAWSLRGVQIGPIEANRSAMLGLWSDHRQLFIHCYKNTKTPAILLELNRRLYGF